MTTRTVLAALLCVTVVFAGCGGFGGGDGDGTATPGADAPETTVSSTEEPTTTETTATTVEDTMTTVAEDTTTTTTEDTTSIDTTRTARQTTGGETTEEPTTTAETDTTIAVTTTASLDTTAVISTATSPEGTNASGSEAFRFLAFEQPGTYTYEVRMVSSDDQEQTGEYVIEVLEASENQYEVQVSLSMGSMSNEQTFTGTRQAVQQQLLSSPAGALLAPLSTMTGFYGGQPLQVGQSWSYSSEEGSTSFEVTGTDSYAGVDCFVSEARLNGTVVHEACASPDRGLAPYAAYYDESGTLTFEMTLVNYEEG